MTWAIEREIEDESSDESDEGPEDVDELIESQPYTNSSFLGRRARFSNSMKMTIICRYEKRKNLSQGKPKISQRIWR